MSEVDDFQAEQAKDWGTYVAVAQIFVGNALAYNPGDPVPASNVELHGYAEDGLVAKRNTKAAAAATDSAAKG